MGHVPQARAGTTARIAGRRTGNQLRTSASSGFSIITCATSPEPMPMTTETRV